MGSMCWTFFQILWYVGFECKGNMTDTQTQKIELSIASGVPLEDVQIMKETTKTTAAFLPLVVVFFGRDHGF